MEEFLLGGEEKCSTGGMMLILHYAHLFVESGVKDMGEDFYYLTGAQYFARAYTKAVAEVQSVVALAPQLVLDR